MKLSKPDRDLVASALAEYIAGRWGISDPAGDPSDDGWVRPAQLLVELAAAGARCYDVTHTHTLVPNLRTALEAGDARGRLLTDPEFAAAEVERAKNARYG